MRVPGKVRQLQYFELLVREGVESLPDLVAFLQVSAKASLGWERGAEASTLSCVLRRLAWERIWSIPRLWTMERIQVRTLPRSAR